MDFCVFKDHMLCFIVRNFENIIIKNIIYHPLNRYLVQKRPFKLISLKHALLFLYGGFNICASYAFSRRYFLRFKLQFFTIENYHYRLHSFLNVNYNVF